MTIMSQDLSHWRVLAAFAHPDDEGFGCGGTLAMLVARGAQVTLVCATNGDVGEISDPALATPENLGSVRQQELRNAMAVTGVKDLRFLNYRDSGMVGTEENDHPDCLHQADAGEVVSRLVEIMQEVAPRIVITHDPSGGYGHPDHRAVCRHTTAAFEQVANSKEGSGGPGPETGGEQPELLYYVCFPRSNFQRVWRTMVEMDITPPFANQDIDLVGTPDDLVTTTVALGEYVDTKIASLNCHRTQIDPNGPFSRLPEELNREIMGSEYYMLAVPKDAAQSQDLLAQL